MFSSKEIRLKPAKTEPVYNSILSYMGENLVLTEDTIDGPAKTENYLNRSFFLVPRGSIFTGIGTLRII